jgi:putative ATP-dependent endonuclease of the OLD family
MKIRSLKIRNYRTLESVDLDFPSSYSAICGANDSGKTNVVRAIRSLMRESSLVRYPSNDQLSIKEDFPKWSEVEPAHREIKIEVTIALDKDRDAGFYLVACKQLSIDAEVAGPTLELMVSVLYRPEVKEPVVTVTARGQLYSGGEAQEVLKKLQSSEGILFHNSTQMDSRVFYGQGSFGGFIQEIAGQHENLVSTMKKTVNRGLAKISKSQQSEFESLLGRLETKYKVGLSCPAFELNYLPFTITLGDQKFEVPLDDWGSGTKNRTLILLTLFRASQVGELEASASKVTPVIVIEEPESFLHPAAQAELGILLHHLAEELKVQVIVTTHSPYLMSMQNPSSNILLRRRTVYKRLRDTERVDTSGEDWMAPFGQALGLDAEEFKPWKSLILSGSDAVLLVEGDTDKQYFSMLQDQSHGANRLVFPGEIISYEGTGSLQNTVLLRFIKNRYRKLFVTFDLDAASRLQKPLESLQLEERKHFLGIGFKAAGKRNIEGLLPDSVTSAVYATNASLVQIATAGEKDEQESARNKLKRLYLEEFKRVAKPGPEYYGNFYPIVRTINKALQSSS